MKGYFSSIIACSKNHCEELKKNCFEVDQDLSRKNWSITISTVYMAFDVLCMRIVGGEKEQEINDC